jgi:hypothetical protein
MRTLFLIGVTDPDSVAWARWLRDVMESWPAQLVILLLYVGLAALLVRHASREWDRGVRNPSLVAFLIASGAFFVLQFLVGSSLLDVVDWPTGLFVIEFVLVFALWLYWFVRFVTRQRSGPGDDESRERGAALEGIIMPPKDPAAAP